MITAADPAVDPIETSVVGGNHGVYPHLEGWEWPIAAYLFVGGLVAGLMVFAGVLGRRREPLRSAIAIADRLAAPALVVGLILLWIDLANRWNVWRLYTTFRLSSAMSWGSWILAFASIVVIVRFVANGVPERWIPSPLRPIAAAVRRQVERFGAALDVASIVLGIGVGLYTGVLLSSISARPLWDSPLLAPLFLVSGLAAGGAAILFGVDAETRHRLAPVSIGLGVVELALLGLFVASTDGRVGVADSALEIFTSGSYAVAFWGVVVTAGLLIPLSIEVIDRRHPLADGWSPTASALTLTGSATLRWVVLFGGLAGVAA